jgi:hypothetical protein
MTKYLGVLFLLVPGIAWAAPCSSALSVNARLVYDASLPALTPGTTVRDAVTAKTKELVMEGKLTQSDARPAAQEAGRCLMQGH